MGYFDRQFKVPDAFQALTGCLQHFVAKTSVKLVAEEGDSDEAKLAARNEYERFIEAIERVAEPVMCHAFKDGDKYAVKFSFEHAYAVESLEAFKAILDQPTVADPSVKFDVELEESPVVW